MKVFIGSSRETLSFVHQVASWLEDAGHEPLPWDDPELFLPGDNTFRKLIEISKESDGAIFIFGEDDKVWYRRDALAQPRDNVLVEYGLFSGALGQNRVVVCRSGESKMPTDIGGILYVDLDRQQRARVSIYAWLRAIARSGDSQPDDAPFAIQQAMLRKELDDTRERLAFAENSVGDLRRLVTQSGIVDFDTYQGQDRLWKLLFDYEYFWDLARYLDRRLVMPDRLVEFLSKAGLGDVAAEINYEQLENPYRTRMYVAKVLRMIRQRYADNGPRLLDRLLSGDPELSAFAQEAGQDRIRELTRGADIGPR